MACTCSTLATVPSASSVAHRMKLASAAAFTLVVEPTFMVGINIHSIGSPLSITTMAPDAPGSIPIILIWLLRPVSVVSIEVLHGTELVFKP